MVHRPESLVIRHALRLPAPAGPAGEGDVAARQFDAALMSVGFKLSADALRTLSALPASTVVDIAVPTLAAVRAMAGDHVRHNVCFKDFPANVPDTFDFWMRCVREALEDGKARSGVLAQLRNGVINLLTLPSYGTYRHTYEEMLAAHDELTAAVGDRLTVLHLGGPLDDEVTALYLAPAGSSTPLGPRTGSHRARAAFAVLSACSAYPRPNSTACTSSGNIWCGPTRSAQPSASGAALS